MFGKKRDNKAAPEVAAAPEPGMTIHVMPRQFYGIEATLTPGTPEPTKAPAPVLPISPVAIVPPKTPVVRPIIVKKNRSWIGLMVALVVFLGLLGGGGYFAYRQIQAAQEAEQQAQAALEELANKPDTTPVQQIPVTSEPTTPTPAKDTDSDGLTDVEESLYGTNVREPDSDKDSFLDGNEVFHRYDPLGPAPQTLLDTGAVKVFSDAEYAYGLYYPTTWSLALTRENASVTFRSTRSAFVTVSAEAKDPAMSIDDWLLGKVSEGVKNQMKKILTKEGYIGFSSKDDRTSYLDLGDRVVTLVYDLGDKMQIEYLQTFQMMVNSFKKL